MRLTIHLEGRPPIELDVPTATTPPDRAKLIEAIFEADVSWRVAGANDGRTPMEVHADAALAFFAENAPVRHVVPEAVRAFVGSYHPSRTDPAASLDCDNRMSYAEELHRWKAARAAIEALDNSTGADTDAGSSPARSMTTDPAEASVRQSVGASAGARVSAPSPQAMTDEEIARAYAEEHGFDWSKVAPRIRDDEIEKRAHARALLAPTSVRAGDEPRTATEWMIQNAAPDSRHVLVERGELGKLRELEVEHVRLNRERHRQEERAEYAERRASDAEAAYHRSEKAIEMLGVELQRASAQIMDATERATAAEAKAAELESALVREVERHGTLQADLAAAEAKLADARLEIDALKCTAMRFNDLSEILGARGDEGPTLAARRVVAERDAALAGRDAALAREVYLPLLVNRDQRGASEMFVRGFDSAIDALKSANPGVAFKEQQ